MNCKRNLINLIFSLLLSSWLIPFAVSSQNLPPITFTISDSAATTGYYFMSPYIQTPPFFYAHPLMILDKYGRTVFYRSYPGPLGQNITNDFKIQPDGRMSFFNTTRGKFYFMDSTFTVVDSIACVNGFETDTHDLQVTDEGHYLLLGREVRVMNLSAYHWFGVNHTTPGGVNAQVEGVVIQEFDENKNLVWEWKGHDHFQFSDVDSIWLFSPTVISWTHSNSVEKDLDGNILLSSRHFDEVTKINRTNGNIIWRFGGKRNQFTFLNDPVRFTGQHDVRRVSDTSISMFDNGQYTNPPEARALEYALDETEKTARLVWNYIDDPDMFSQATGNHQYITNGNHLVDYGFNGQNVPWMVVVKPDYTKILEVTIPHNYISYRAFNYPELPWQLNRPAVDCEQIDKMYYLVAEPGHSEYLWSNGSTSSQIPITQPGNYWVYVPYGDGMISSEPLTITDIENPCPTTPVADPQSVSRAGLRCFPNPASGNAHVTITLDQPGKVSLTVQSLQGMTVQKRECGLLPAGKSSIDLDIASVLPGIYLLILQSDQIRCTEKMVVR